MKLLILSLITLQVCHSTPLRDDFELTLIGDKRLFFSNDKLNFYEAENYCRRFNTSLFAINSQEEQDDLVEYIRNNGYWGKSFWTSGNDLGEEGQFYWLSNGKRMIYTNWFKGEPNNYVINGVSENCVLIWYKSDYKWNDGHCHVPEYFICEL